jgi:DNA-binding transcriptional LysR family regulator
MTLEIRHLRTFLVCVSEGTISRAAKRLHVAQPAVSRTLTELERHLQCGLLTRSAAGITLTTDGSAFHPKAVSAVAAFDDAVSSPPRTVRPLYVGHAWSALGEHTSSLLRQWKTLHPDVPIVLRRFDDASGGLSNASVDVAVVRGSAPHDDGPGELLYSEPRVAAVPTGHALHDRVSLDLDDLAHYPLVLNTISGTTDHNLWNNDHALLIAAEVQTVDDWQSHIAAGTGIGVTPASTARLHPHPEITYIPLRDAPPVPVYLAWRRWNQHPLLEEFLGLVRDVSGH